MVGNVDGKTAVIIDDMISTAGTLQVAAEALIERGAVRVFATAVHPVLAGDAVNLIENSPIEKLVVTDTLPLADAQRSARIEVLTVAPLLADAIMRIHKDLSISALFH
jgi:ribose-phosphate pyrophosphokinase